VARFDSSPDPDPLATALGESRDAVRAAARGVLDRYDRAYWLDCARHGRFTDEMWQAMVDQGLLGLGVPEGHGGSGGGLTEVTAAMEVLSSAGVPLALYLLTAFAREAILRHGTDEQCKRFVTPTVTGQERLCFAITEPNAGTNSFAMETFASRAGDGTYRLNGQKLFISAVDASDRMMVVARTVRRNEVDDRRRGLSLFVVDVDAPGLSHQPLDIEIVMPDRQFAVFFDDVELDADRLIGEDGEGFRYLFDALNPERMLAAAWAIGLGDYALGKAVAYARERAPFGAPIGSYQALQHPLAEARARLDAARLMMFTACRVFDAGGDAGYLSNAAKLLASQAAVFACDRAVQTFGGYAFDADYDVSTIWPAVRLLEIAPVNNEMILNYIGEHVLGLPRSY
jgi:acyl-CoA dehydrogenase